MKYPSKNQTFIPIIRKMIARVNKNIWLKILLSISILYLVSIFWYSFAQNDNLDRWDCLFVQDKTWWNFWIMFDTRSGQNETVYPKESIRAALLNLKAYCCNEWWIIGKEHISCKYDADAWLFPKEYPQSKFLYDHLVDVGLRRLDAMDNLLYEGVVPDPLWKAWRDFINKKWSQEEWTSPSDIVPEFNKKRTKDERFILRYWEDGNYNEQYQENRLEITKEYESRPLVNRYGNICEISAYIYGYLKWLDLWDHTQAYWYPACLLLTRNIISRNIVFTKAIVLKKSNKLLYDNVQSHMANYISKTRLTKLKETILWIVQAFNVVNKKVVQLIKECS